MPRLDAATLFILTALVDAGLAVIMAYVYRTERTYPGFRDWVLAATLQASGLVLLTTRPFVPLVFSALMAGALLVAAADRIWRGLQRFAGEPGRRSTDAVVVYALAGITFAYFLFWHPSTGQRILVFSVATAYPLARAALFCIRRFPEPFRTDGRFLGGLLAALVLIDLARGAAAWWQPQAGADLLVRGSAESIMTMVGAAVLLLVVVMFPVLNGRRLRLDLEAASAQVRQLEGIIPICMYCKKIRDDRQAWHALDEYVASHSGARFSHGVCPDCMERFRAG
jgi:hypothetical protein